MNPISLREIGFIIAKSSFPCGETGLGIDDLEGQGI
jgi:hypothetical protein